MEEENAPGDYLLLGDQPSIDSEDALGFDPIARDLARLIATSSASTPFTLGIEGGWGQGKSSLMGRIAASLAHGGPNRLEVATTSFNAWTAGDGDVLEGLVKSVLDQLDESILRRVARNRRLISWVRAFGSLLASILQVGSIVDRLWSELDVDPKARNEMRDLMATALREWREKPAKLGRDRMLVIFIDDLDRCSPENVFQVFEAVKLYLDAPGLAFVLGFDSGIVSDAILHEKQFSDKVSGDHYLEKVIQIRYRLPTTSDAHAGQLIASYLRDSRTMELFDETARTLVVERNQRNPRRIKRFINSFILEYGIDREWHELGPETLIRVLIIDFHFPDFAALLRSRRSSDPTDDLLRLVEAADLIKGKASGAAIQQRVRETFATHGIEPLDDHGKWLPDALENLQREFPEVVARLSRDREFVDLVEGLGNAEQRGRVRTKLQRRRAPTSGATPVGSADREARLQVLAGLRVLWICDSTRGIEPDMNELARYGVGVRRVHNADLEPSDLADAEAIVISDFSSTLDVPGWLHTLRFLRGNGCTVPISVISNRATTGQQRDAHELGAVTPTTWSDQIDFLVDLATRTATAEISSS